MGMSPSEHLDRSEQERVPPLTSGFDGRVDAEFASESLASELRQVDAVHFAEQWHALAKRIFKSEFFSEDKFRFVGACIQLAPILARDWTYEFLRDAQKAVGGGDKRFLDEADVLRCAAMALALGESPRDWLMTTCGPRGPQVYFEISRTLRSQTAKWRDQVVRTDPFLVSEATMTGRLSEVAAPTEVWFAARRRFLQDPNGPGENQRLKAWTRVTNGVRKGAVYNFVAADDAARRSAEIVRNEAHQLHPGIADKLRFFTIADSVGRWILPRSALLAVDHEPTTTVEDLVSVAAIFDCFIEIHSADTGGESRLSYSRLPPRDAIEVRHGLRESTPLP
jgi:hypothetical protein